MRLSTILAVSSIGSATAAAAASAMVPLCKVPQSGDSDVFITCDIEHDDFFAGGGDDSSSSRRNETLKEGTILSVVEYNVDRNGSGGDGSKEAGMDPILKLLSDRTVFPEWDVLIMSEVAR